jgi:nucleotide-binding universal stress UspA family protein
MPKILVALDGSPSSEKALQVAVKLAQQNSGQLMAVSVVNRPGDPYLQGAAEGLKAKMRRHLQEILQAAANFARSRGVRLTPVLREGHPAETIVECAEQEGSELLIIGSHNDSSPSAGLGGTTDQVSSHSPCTVMIVK